MSYLLVLAIIAFANPALAQLNTNQNNTQPLQSQVPPPSTAGLGAESYQPNNAPAVIPQPLQMPSPASQYNAPQAPEPEDENRQPKLHFCNTDEAEKVWKLVRILETPEGVRSEEFHKYPFQYLWLTPRKFYYSGKLQMEINNAAQIKHTLYDINRDSIFQFIIGDQGTLFIYKDQKFLRSYYCAISEEAVGIYRIGDMLLTPTTQAGGKLFEVYREVLSPKT